MEDNTGYAATEEIQAKLFARAVELQQLKSPASAQFGELEEMFVTEIDENVYSVSGYVDAHNSFGAMVRTKFDLKVFKDEDGTWKNANKFISTEASIAGTVVSHTILYWVLGIIGTIITLAVSYFFMSQTLGF